MARIKFLSEKEINGVMWNSISYGEAQRLKDTCRYIEYGCWLMADGTQFDLWGTFVRVLGDHEKRYLTTGAELWLEIENEKS